MERKRIAEDKRLIAEDALRAITAQDEIAMWHVKLRQERIAREEAAEKERLEKLRKQGEEVKRRQREWDETIRRRQREEDRQRAEAHIALPIGWSERKITSDDIANNADFMGKGFPTAYFHDDKAPNGQLNRPKHQPEKELQRQQEEEDSRVGIGGWLSWKQREEVAAQNRKTEELKTEIMQRHHEVLRRQEAERKVEEMEKRHREELLRLQQKVEREAEETKKRKEKLKSKESWKDQYEQLKQTEFEAEKAQETALRTQRQRKRLEQHEAQIAAEQELASMRLERMKLERSIEEEKLQKALGYKAKQRQLKERRKEVRQMEEAEDKENALLTGFTVESSIKSLIKSPFCKASDQRKEKLIGMMESEAVYNIKEFLELELNEWKNLRNSDNKLYPKGLRKAVESLYIICSSLKE